MSRCMLSSFNLSADLAGFHICLRIKSIDDRGLANATWPCHHCGFALQPLSDRIYAFLQLSADKKHFITAFSISLDQFLLFLFSGNILLVKADQTGKGLLLHGNQKTIQKIIIGIRLHDSKDHKCLIHIGRRRTDQCVFPWQDLCDITDHFFHVHRHHLYQISYKRLFLFLPEYSLGLAFKQS